MGKANRGDNKIKTFNLSIPGFTIACSERGNPKNPPILAIHGWLDNANSFTPIAKFLEEEFYLIAIDLPGHGHSSHLPEGCPYHFLDGIFIIIEILNALKMDKVHLLGHSMGACLASLVAGIVPERFLTLNLIEGLGPFSQPAETACNQLRGYAHLLPHKSKLNKGYDSVANAALVRAIKGYVSLDIAKILCERSLIEKEGRFYWRHDSRLLVRSSLMMTETQVLSCLQQITANTLLIMANQGFSFDPEISTNRIKAVKNLQLKEMIGGHHIHMEQPEMTSQLITEFIKMGRLS